MKVGNVWPLFVTAVGSVLLSCSDSDATTGSATKPGLAAGAAGVIEACDNYCDRCGDGSGFCDSACRDSFDPSVVRGTFLSSLLECESCSVEADNRTCSRGARDATGPATQLGIEFCLQYESVLEPCLVESDEGFDDCEDWTRQVADASLERFDPCFTYTECTGVFECIQQVFVGEAPEPYTPDCSDYDAECEEPEDPRNSCPTANDYRCDGPNVCPVGTDTNDCEINDFENRCALAYNGNCDEPGTCKPETDTFDCDRAPYGNSCEHAYDGVCDEPRRCLEDTDSYDCSFEPELDAGTDSGTPVGDAGVDGGLAADAAVLN